jgi:hypothetical protein
MNRVRFTSMLFAATLLAGTAGSFAADPAKAPPAPTKEMRQQMAVAHEKMAACLRSDKPISECREEMQKSCHDMMGEQGCPMMGMHRHERMMKPPAPGASDPK